jgi:ureidoacrylate peracid hydrolase
MIGKRDAPHQTFKVNQYNLPTNFDLDKVALMVVDMENDFIHSEGILAKQGFCVVDLDAFVKRVSNLMNLFKINGLPVIATRHIIREDTHGHAVGGGLWVEMRPFLKVAGFRQDTWGAKLIDNLPVPDYVIEKPRFSAFYETGLESLLRGLNTEVIVFSGVATNVCVESTIRDAFCRDFRTISIENCMAAYTLQAHEASLLALRFLGAVISLNELSHLLALAK